MPIMQWFYRHKGDTSRCVVVRTRTQDGSIVGWEWSELGVPEEQRTSRPE
jgi:hypothetical protein